MRFSVIVPIYNAQTYLNCCLSSIVNQNYEDYEVILVNDGSTDESASICKQYQLQYSHHIRYVEQENKGQYAARMLGVKLARGEYCCFVDSDDAVLINYFEILEQAIQKSQADIVLFESEVINEKGQALKLNCEQAFREGTVAKEKILEQMILSQLNPMWNKAYRRTLFEYIHLTSKQMIVRIGEDLLQNIPLIEHADTFYYVKNIIYQYRKNSNSISYNLRKRNIMEVDITRNEVYHCMERLQITDDFHKKIFYEQYLEEVGRELRYSSCKREVDDIQNIYAAEHMKLAEKYLENASISKWKKIQLKLFYKKRWKIMYLYCKILIFIERGYDFIISYRIKGMGRIEKKG